MSLHGDMINMLVHFMKLCILLRIRQFIQSWPNGISYKTINFYLQTVKTSGSAESSRLIKILTYLFHFNLSTEPEISNTHAINYIYNNFLY